jgi:hypothetical protein
MGATAFNTASAIFASSLYKYSAGVGGAPNTTMYHGSGGGGGGIVFDRFGYPTASRGGAMKSAHGGVGFGAGGGAGGYDGTSYSGGAGAPGMVMFTLTI